MMGEYGFVYLFFRHKDDDEPVYVGFTTNPTQRLLSHFGKNARGNGKLGKEAYKQITQIKVAHVGTEEDARRLEAVMIYKYSPEFNTEGVAIFPQECSSAPDWRKWTSFSKDELIRDKTIVFRCLGQSETIEGLKKEASELKKEATELEYVVKSKEHELRSARDNYDSLKYSYDCLFDSWKKDHRHYDEMSKHCIAAIDRFDREAEIARSICKQYRDRSDNMPFLAKLLGGFTMKMVGAK